MKRIVHAFGIKSMSVINAKALTLAVSMLMICMAFNPPGAMAITVDISEFQWKNRLLFLFAPDPNNPSFIKLHNEILAQKDEIRYRDLIIFEIIEQGSSKMNQTDLDPKAAESLRRRFAVPLGTFTVILVGKDGGVKLRRSESIPLEKIFGLIDSMPMRQQEMRQRGR